MHVEAKVRLLLNIAERKHHFADSLKGFKYQFNAGTLQVVFLATLTTSLLQSLCTISN